MNTRARKEDATGQLTDLLGDSASWRVLGLLFERPRGTWKDDLVALAAEIPDAALASLARRAATEGTEAHFLAVLGPGGTVSPREAAYRRMGDPGHLLARLRHLYESFAYLARVEEPPDHVSVEAGFVAYLRLKESYAMAQGDAPSASMASDATALFLAEHLSHLAVGLRTRFDLLDDDYLSAAASHLYSLLEPFPESVVQAASAGGPDAEPLDSCGGGCAPGR